jgi:hypothetical protein
MRIIFLVGQLVKECNVSYACYVYRSLIRPSGSDRVALLEVDVSGSRAEAAIAKEVSAIAEDTRLQENVPGLIENFKSQFDGGYQVGMFLRLLRT